MAKRFNNLYLLVFLIALVGVFFLLKNTKGKKSERTFEKEFLALDTADIDQILLYLKAENHEEIKLFKQDNVWKVQKGGIVANAQPYRAKGIITELSNIKPTRLAAKSKSKWEEYQVTDSLGTRVKVLDDGGNVVYDLMIGKLSFLQNPNQQGGMSGGQNAKGISYIRQTDQNEIYAVDGYLPMTFNQGFSDWRDGTFLKFTSSDITNINFAYPADSGYSIGLIDSTWVIGNGSADGQKIQSYLSALSNKNSNTFDDNFKPTTNPEFKLKIEGNNMNDITVLGYQKSPNEIVLNSSLNPDVYVLSTPSGLFKDLFRSKASFL